MEETEYLIENWYWQFMYVFVFFKTVWLYKKRSKEMDLINNFKVRKLRRTVLDFTLTLRTFVYFSRQVYSLKYCFFLFQFGAPTALDTNQLQI